MLSIEFCGEVHEVPTGTSFSIGREGDLAVDDNPYLHRRFLLLHEVEGLWILTNAGTQLTATVSDGSGLLDAFLAPGASLPVALSECVVAFTAGPTSYSFAILNDEPPFMRVPVAVTESGDTTIGATSLTPDQRRLIVALAEPRLRREGGASTQLPSNGDAAARLGWTITRFNRKLDNVCQKLQKIGVRGLHGGPDKLASNRRVRLVEYAVSTRLVTKADLVLLDTVTPEEDE
jgi:hypothetical protein